jgi:hypothetical protein
VRTCGREPAVEIEHPLGVDHEQLESEPRSPRCRPYLQHPVARVVAAAGGPVELERVELHEHTRIGTAERPDLLDKRTLSAEDHVEPERSRSRGSSTSI